MFRRLLRLCGRKSPKTVFVFLFLPPIVFYLSPELENGGSGREREANESTESVHKMENPDSRPNQDALNKVPVKPYNPINNNEIDAPMDKEKTYVVVRKEEAVLTDDVRSGDDVRSQCSSSSIKCNLRVNEYWFSNLEHKISGCLIPKCASSTLRRLFFQMSGAKDWNDPKMTEHRIHALSRNLKHYYHHSQKRPIMLTPHYKLFTFTREPFARIVSYYHSKILKMHPFYYKSIIRKILIQQDNVKNAPVEAEKAVAMGLQASFKGLVKYIANYTGKDDVHWAPMCNLCQFCLYNYSFFGKLENAAEDFPKLMQYLGFSEDQTPVHTFSTLNASSQTVIDHFRDIERADVERLQQKYINDYQLLHYPLPTSYLPQFKQ